MLHNLIGWLLYRAFMPRWIGRTRWFKARYCLCKRQTVQRVEPAMPCRVTLQGVS